YTSAKVTGGATAKPAYTYTRASRTAAMPPFLLSRFSRSLPDNLFTSTFDISAQIPALEMGLFGPVAKTQAGPAGHKKSPRSNARTMPRAGRREGRPVRHHS